MGVKTAKNRIAHLPRRLDNSEAVIPITKRGRPVMALMSWELFEALVETIEVMSEPDLMAQISQSEKDVSEGRTVPLNEVMAEINIKPGIAPSSSKRS